jgi:hypothetical protein
MKLMIDTTDKDNVKIQCDTLNAYELGMCIGKCVEIIADEMDLHSMELKLQIAQRIRKGIVDSENAEVTDIKDMEC